MRPGQLSCPGCRWIIYSHLDVCPHCGQATRTDKSQVQSYTRALTAAFVFAALLIVGLVAVNQGTEQSPPGTENFAKRDHQSSWTDPKPRLEAANTNASEQPVRLDLLTSQALAKPRLLGLLKDPDSAKFSEVFAVKEPNGFAFCGLVNSKNSLGAYPGNIRFIATPILAFLEGAPGFDEAWDSACRREQIDVSF